jgi:hypothetical protein
MSTAVRRPGPTAATVLAFAVATALTGSIALAQNAYVNLPDMGSGANAMISRADEFQVGRMMMKNLRDENMVLEDPETTEYMQAMGSRIGAQAQEGTQLHVLRREGPRDQRVRDSGRLHRHELRPDPADVLGVRTGRRAGA